MTGRPTVAELEAHGRWYHTLELPGMTTKGLFDLRGILPDLPWPDVKGKRCLDVGTYDGCLAFEMEKRGASEVVAVDVATKDLYDWPANVRPGVGEYTAREVGLRNGVGFRLAADALGSKVDWRPVSIYDLSPETVGTFDVVTCSSLLLHLRDPIRALEAIRSVCTGQFMSFEPIDLWLTLLHRRTAVAKFDGMGILCQWWTPSGPGQARMLRSAGFELDHVDKPRIVAFNLHSNDRLTPRVVRDRLLARAATGTWQTGVLQRAVVTHPVLGHG
jgi:tRNA (mo5U34)-methyltransferase